MVDTLQTLGWYHGPLRRRSRRARWRCGPSLLADDLEPADEAADPERRRLILVPGAASPRPSSSRGSTSSPRPSASPPSGRPGRVRGWIDVAEGRLGEARRHWETVSRDVPDAGRPSCASGAGGVSAVGRRRGEGRRPGPTHLAATGVHLPATDCGGARLPPVWPALRGDAAEAIGRVPPRPRRVAAARPHLRGGVHRDRHGVRPRPGRSRRSGRPPNGPRDLRADGREAATSSASRRLMSRAPARGERRPTGIPPPARASG